MSFEISVGTFNIGQGRSDYSYMLSNKPSELNFVTQQVQEKFQQLMVDKGYDEDTLRRNPEEEFNLTTEAYAPIMKIIEESTAEKLAKQCDVIALQEVMDFNRPFIKKLEESGFEIYHVSPEEENPRVSTAIALRVAKFDVKNISIFSKSQTDANIQNAVNGQNQEIKKPYGQEIAAVVAKIKNSTIEIAFSSLHSWGFQLYNPETPLNERYLTKDDKNNIFAGGLYTAEACELLKEHPFSVIAGDMNNNPNNDPSQFDLLHTSGYDVLNPDAITNINGGDLTYTTRKIDFINVSPSNAKISIFKRMWRAFSSIFVSRTYMTYTPARVLKGFEFTRTGNCSDHKPVVTKLKIHSRSTLSRLFHAILPKSC